MIEADQIINQNSENSHKVLLIDLESCPTQIKHLPEVLEAFAQVIICYAHTGAKIPLDWLLPLSATVTSGKLSIFKMASTGKNSADFGLCFFAGVLMERLDKETHFTIASNDTDLDHVVNLLKSHGRSAERIGTKKEDERIPAAIPQVASDVTPPVSPIKIYCAHLITYSKNRPARRDTLLNSLKNKFKDTPEAASEVLRLLTAQGAISFSDKKVSYNDKKIKELAK